MRVSDPLLPGRGFDPERLLAPQQAMSLFFSRAQFAPAKQETCALRDARSRILACDIAADGDYPRTARSTMDGYAVRSADLPGDLRIAGSVAMGQWLQVTPGPRQAVEIPTGGAVPLGFDAVVPMEDAVRDGDQVTIAHAVPAGDCITHIAEDMRAGEIVLRAGRRIGPAESAVLATLGYEQVPVLVRPVFGVLSGGDELVAPGAEPNPAQVRDSNRFAIAAALESMGALARHFPTVGDNPGQLEAALRAALPECDGLIVTGGSSVGERDGTPGAIEALGEPGVIVHGLRVKPGKPTVLAAVGAKPVIGLPGNPTSALMIFEAVAEPVVRALTGWHRRRFSVSAALAEPLRGRPGWTWFVPVRLEDSGEWYVARPLQIRSSYVSLAARADGFVTLGEDDGPLEAGAIVNVRRFSEES